MSTHPAAVLTAANTITIEDRPNPIPGPDDLLVDVKTVALNPVDIYMRAGFMVSKYPHVLGSDIAGPVLAVGDAVPQDSPFRQPGARVSAFASMFYERDSLDYGAFQTQVLVKAHLATPLPETYSYREGTLFPMQVGTGWNGFHTLGLPASDLAKVSDGRPLLVWGAGSSMGAGAVQIARWAGYTVYATASAHHHDLVKKLGASHVFDYKTPDVVDQIVGAAKKEGHALTMAYIAAGGPKEVVEVLRQARGGKPAVVASAPNVAKDLEPVEGVEVRFVLPPMDDKEKQAEHFRWVYNVWLAHELAEGRFIPSPAIKVMKGGLAALDKGLDILKEGVSGEKLVFDL